MADSMTDTTRPLSAAEQWAKKLYDDLAFAAPELWPMHMTRRFEEALDAARSLPSVEALRKDRPHGNWDSGWNAAIDAILARLTEPAGDKR